jgi:glycosidase
MKKKIFRNVLAIFLMSSMFLAASCENKGQEESKIESEITNESKGEEPPMIDPVNDNFRTFYQVFVGSFSDSDGDGCGDIRGIINRMDYLNDGNINSGKSLGVQGLWLSPIFSSPSYHKYDALDYYKIDSKFGTEDDLKELIELCHSRNVKVILDLAINHTSNGHLWFTEFKDSRMKGDTENEYYDYYSCVTTEEKETGITYGKIAGVDCWYECNFSGGMPELNFDNDEVRKETLDIAKYYLDLGVDGFRFDAIKYIYYGNTEKSADFWEWYMSELKKIKNDIYCVGECWSGESEILEYYGGMNCFNFALSQAEGAVAQAAKGMSITRYTKYIESFQKAVLEKNPEGMVMGFLSNHDMDRIASCFATENNMRMAANLYLLSPGSPVIYYGEELGMRGSRGGDNTDANRRLAMLWGDGDTVKNPTGSTYPDSNQIKSTVLSQLEDENSLCNYYKKLIAIRHKYEAIPRGIYKSISLGDKNIGGYIVEYGNEKIILIHNNSKTEVTVDLKSCKDLEAFSEFSLEEYIGVGAATLSEGKITVSGQTSAILK